MLAQIVIVENISDIRRACPVTLAIYCGDDPSSADRVTVGLRKPWNVRSSTTGTGRAICPKMFETRPMSRERLSSW